MIPVIRKFFGYFNLKGKRAFLKNMNRPFIFIDSAFKILLFPSFSRSLLSWKSSVYSFNLNHFKYLSSSSRKKMQHISHYFNYLCWCRFDGDFSGNLPLPQLLPCHNWCAQCLCLPSSSFLQFYHSCHILSHERVEGE